VAGLKGVPVAFCQLKPFSAFLSASGGGRNRGAKGTLLVVSELRELRKSRTFMRILPSMAVVRLGRFVCLATKWGEVGVVFAVAIAE
jgi:hypothetical protein